MITYEEERYFIFARRTQTNATAVMAPKAKSGLVTARHMQVHTEWCCLQRYAKLNALGGGVYCANAAV